uniref:Uncharacterized protein n=1 Tax=Heterorhabditis bacteriophora TaxID=37862 RepID=A0A1I7WFH9_HETBA
MRIVSHTYVKVFLSIFRSKDIQQFSLFSSSFILYCI